MDELPASSQAALDPEKISEQSEEAEREEKRLDCLERCLEKLEPESREIITRYYQGEQRAKIKNRRALAEALGHNDECVEHKSLPHTRPSRRLCEQMFEPRVKCFSDFVSILQGA
ncbi:MAG TPA: hypothetical protein VNN73_03885 [Blastocatellia bacterium]|nr:hypothetical protein [Blastocatellia bacterium]